MVFYPRRVLVLIAPNFQEDAISLVAHLRSSGTAVSLVGLATGLIHSLHGVATQPDCTLAQINHVADRHLLIITGGAECATTLLSDPRTHQLAQRVIDYKGWVAVLHQAQNLVYQTFKKTWDENPDHFIQQNDADIIDFAQLLMRRL